MTPVSVSASVRRGFRRDRTVYMSCDIYIIQSRQTVHPTGTDETKAGGISETDKTAAAALSCTTLAPQINQ